MNFLINCSNLKAGGGLQVADSVCCQLERFRKHHFVVVLSDFLNFTKKKIAAYPNVELYDYNIPNSFRTVILGRDGFLDKLVATKNIQGVLTVFGPSRWAPKVPHLSGFALPQLVIPESPYFTRMDKITRKKWWIWCKVRQLSLKKTADYFWTENPYISKRFEALMGNKSIFTVSNYYNQVYDHPEKWVRSIKLPAFNGVTCLSVSSPASHKNFGIIEEIVRYLGKAHPEFKVRFVLTCKADQWPMAEDVRDSIIYIGKTDVSECPYLYEQADIMYMPSLLECFTATYPEAMRMEVPIVTTDLEFARGLCGEAACYYSAVDASAAAEAIYKVSTDATFKKSLVEYGKKQLQTYDNYEQRAEKLIHILEEIAQP